MCNLRVTPKKVMATGIDDTTCLRKTNSRVVHGGIIEALGFSESITVPFLDFTIVLPYHFFIINLYLTTTVLINISINCYSISDKSLSYLLNKLITFKYH